MSNKLNNIKEYKRTSKMLLQVVFMMPKPNIFLKQAVKATIITNGVMMKPSDNARSWSNRYVHLVKQRNSTTMTIAYTMVMMYSAQ